MVARNTRQKILDTAVKLFNEKGTMEVTTNHIAEPALDVAQLLFHFYDQYSFLFRDYDYIIRKDPEMARAFRTLIEFRNEMFINMFSGFIDDGLVYPTPEKEVEVYLNSTWILSNHWISFARMMGEEDKTIIYNKGVIHSLLVLKAVMTDKGKALLDQSLKPFWDEIEKAEAAASKKKSAVKSAKKGVGKKSSPTVEINGEHFEFHWYEHRGIGRFEIKKKKVNKK